MHGCQLEGSFYHCLWRGDRGPWYWNVISAYHRWLEHFIWHYICFVQSREASKVEGNKHRHANTNTHTHTHTYTHTDRYVAKLSRELANLQHAEYFICFPHLVPVFALLLTVVSFLFKYPLKWLDFSYVFSKSLRTPGLKNICKRLFLLGPKFDMDCRNFWGLS